MFWKEIFCSWQKIIDITALKNEKKTIDHFDSEGNFISLESLNNLNVNTNILEYAALKMAVLDRMDSIILKRHDLQYKHIV